jgi:hypothetical protein
MLEIQGSGEIRLTRGNTAVLEITPYMGTPDDPVILSAGDKVLFTIKNTLGKVMFQKELGAGDQDPDTHALTLNIEPSDTVSRPEGAYTYDIVLVYSSGEAYTFIPKSPFILTPAVGTYKDLTGGDGS